MDTKKIRSYFLGFFISFVLTIIAYSSVVMHLSTQHTTPSDKALIILLPILAIIQLMVQLIFFLHVSLTPKSRLNLIFLISTGSVILLVVIGSLWIMSHLNYNMTPHEMNEYIRADEGISQHRN